MTAFFLSEERERKETACFLIHMPTLVLSFMVGLKFPENRMRNGANEKKN